MFDEARFALALDELAEVQLSRGESVMLRALGQSMRPSIRHGDRVVLVRRAPRWLDIVWVQQNGAESLHRVVLRVGSRLWLKGDALPLTDGFVEVDAVKACVVLVERDGRRFVPRRLTALPRSLLRGALGLIWR